MQWVNKLTSEFLSDKDSIKRYIQIRFAFACDVFQILQQGLEEDGNNVGEPIIYGVIMSNKSIYIGQSLDSQRRIKDLPIGNIKLAKLTSLHMQNYVNSLRDEGLKRGTLEKIIKIIRNSLEHAIDLVLITKNVAAKTKLHKVDKEELTVWNEQEVQLFLNLHRIAGILLSFIWLL